jgi:hypothetical protein
VEWLILYHNTDVSYKQSKSGIAVYTMVDSISKVVEIDVQ